MWVTRYAAFFQTEKYVNPYGIYTYISFLVCFNNNRKFLCHFYFNEATKEEANARGKWDFRNSPFLGQNPVQS